jgi:hypothetical protein
MMNSKTIYIELIWATFCIWICLDRPSIAHDFPDGSAPSATPTDFLIDDTSFKAQISTNDQTKEISLSNGLIKRTWRVSPNAACVGFDNLNSNQQMIRAVRPEARITIDSVAYDVGGLLGQPNHAFLTPQWLNEMTTDENAMQFVEYAVGETKERLQWKQRRHHAPDSKWPPPGKHLQLHFKFPDSTENEFHRSLKVVVHYEMYDGIPAICKWMTITNDSTRQVTLDRFRLEELAAIEHSNWVEKREGVAYPQPDYLHVETDFAFGGFTPKNANHHVVSWCNDPQYSTQVNYPRETPCLLVVEPEYGPEQIIAAGKSFESFHVFEVAYDNSDRERCGLTLRKFYRTVAPWITENPITHHLLNSNPEHVKRAIDHAAEVGFEAIILSFGSGFNMENTDPQYLDTWKDVADYAQSKNVEIGAYSLFSSRSVGGGNDVVSPPGQSPKFGQAPSATSAWGIQYFKTLADFFDKTGFDQFENDGPYPGDVDITARPPYQKGMNDSRWAQWKIVTGLYKHLRASGVYINQPDYYFLSGGNKTGMGYREVNWSLPRSQQVIHTRQNIYDGTWTKTPSMGWMFVPLTQYQGGGAAATIEPLDQHLDHYQRMMMCNFGMGVQAHYRGPRLFDTDRTKRQVTETVAWFKKYRDILESDIIHGRRADGRDLDWILHVNPKLETRGMLCVYNPIDVELTKTLRVNLYYTGICDTATVSEADQAPFECKLNRDYTVDIPVSVPANAMKWYVIR